MKKRAISFVLCLMMVVTLFGNGIPVYAANELEQPIVSTEETSQDTPEESEADNDAALSTPSEAEPSPELYEEAEALSLENETPELPEEVNETPESTEEFVTDGDSDISGSAFLAVHFLEDGYHFPFPEDADEYEIFESINRFMHSVDPVLIDSEGKEFKGEYQDDSATFTFTFDDLLYGEYTLKYNIPEGYRFAEGYIVGNSENYVVPGGKAEIAPRDRSTYIIFEKVEKAPEELSPDEQAEVEFSKVKLGGKELPGAKIEIYKGTDKVASWESTTASHTLNLEAGTYRFHEEAAPEGFVAVTDFEFTLKADGSITLGKIAPGETIVVENGKITVTDNAKPTPPTPDKKVGDLTVTKTVSGSRGDQNKEFTFTVTLDKQDLNGKYGDMTFTDGVATFTLKHGQSKTANGLPAGVSYTVEESDNSGYTVTKTNATGTIQTGSTSTAAFENYKGSSGGSGGGGGGGSSSHTPQPARVTLTATKTMDGLIPTGSGFTFFLDDANGQRLQVKNNQGGNIAFDTLTFDKTGTYAYYITEQTGNDKNVNYDTSSYKVTVTVTCPYDYAASVSYEKNGQAYNSVPAFANTTKPSAPAPTPTQTLPVVAPARPLDNVPKTEDSSNLALWGILAAASLLSLTVLLAGIKTSKARSQSKEHQS